MQSLLRLLRARFARFSIRRRPKPAKATDPSVPSQKTTAPGTTILSYDSFR